ncbi:hypothetical protein [Lacrimispora indolis]|uniref:hypothetical protein n=1 Tax=Lacrimispora indolis TaxID=69825 RepID=UPI000413153D|nr:hypothetical protein [[Clostridium] methoxybenzovorans]
MKYTQNLNMKIPEGGDPIDILDITGNFETLDEEVNKKASSSGGDISNTTIKTVDTIADSFPVPSAGESSKTFLGKVKKALQDMKDFSTGVVTLGRLVNNGQTTEPGFALDARYGKTLYDLYAQLNSNLTGIQNNFTEIKTVSIYQTRCDGLIGGYVKSGKVVTVAIQFRALSPGTNFAMLTGFPAPLLGSGNVPVEMNGIKTLSNETTGVFINSVGSLCVKNAVAHDYISVSGSYLST